MSMQILTLEFLSISDSVSVGDIGYYASTSNIQGGFSVNSDIIAFGVVTQINKDASPPTIDFIYDSSDYDNDGAADITPPQQGDYIMFGKNNVVNSSSLLGYYAQIVFENNSHEKAELFSIGSEVSQSSR